MKSYRNTVKVLLLAGAAAGALALLGGFSPFGGGLSAAAPGGARLASRPAQSDSPRGPEENVTRATLSNGLRVVIVRDKLAPVATTVVNYLVGSNEAPPDFPGRRMRRST